MKERGEIGEQQSKVVEEDLFLPVVYTVSSKQLSSTLTSTAWVEKPLCKLHTLTQRHTLIKPKSVLKQ